MNQRRILLLALATVMAVVVWYVALFSPVRAERRRLGEQVATAEGQEQELRSALARLRRVASQREVHEAQLAQLGRLVPPEPDVAGFILAANDAAVRSGVNWVSFSPAPPAPGTAGGPSIISVSVAVDGAFATVLEYLRRLEHLERLVVIDSLQLAPSTQAGGALHVSGTMSARIFTTALAAPAADGTAAAQTSAPVGAAGG